MGELDLIYLGGASINVQLTLSNSSIIPVQIIMNDFQGTIRLRIPSESFSDMFGVAFIKDPQVSFTVETPLTIGDNETVRNMINKVLSSIMRLVFVETWVLPSWKHIYIPFLEPQIPIKKVVLNDEIKAPHTPLQNMASRAVNLWKNRSLLNYKDFLDGKVFDCSVIVSKNDIDSIEPPLIEETISMFEETFETVKPTNPLQKHETEEPGIWKLLKRKQGILLHKKTSSSAEIFRSSVIISVNYLKIAGMYLVIKLAFQSHFI
jgi:hypothetical protein